MLSIRVQKLYHLPYWTFTFTKHKPHHNNVHLTFFLWKDLVILGDNCKDFLYSLGPEMTKEKKKKKITN